MVKLNASFIGDNDFTLIHAILITLFTIVLFVTDSFTMAMGFFIFFMGFWIFCEQYLIKKTWQEKLKRFSINVLFPLFYFMYLSDVISTYFAVKKYAFAFEQNETLIWLWGKFGYPLGQLINFIQASLIISIILFMATRKNKIVSLIGFLTFILLIIIYTPIIINNFILLYNYSCKI